MSFTSAALGAGPSSFDARGQCDRPTVSESARALCSTARVAIYSIFLLLIVECRSVLTAVHGAVVAALHSYDFAPEVRCMMGRGVVVVVVAALLSYDYVPEVRCMMGKGRRVCP